MWYFPGINAIVRTGLVWVVLVSGVGVTVLLYYIILKVQAAISFPSSLSSHTFMHIFGSFVGQALEHIPWLSAGRVRYHFYSLTDANFMTF